METNDIKSMWKENIGGAITPYSKPELDKIVLKSARKSIGSAYLNAWQTVLLLLLTLFCLGMGIRYATSVQLWIFWLSCIVLLTVGLGISVWSRKKMQRYAFDMPLKEWIKTRMDEFDRSIRLKKKYRFSATYGPGLVILAVFCILLTTTAGFSLRGVLPPLITGLACLAVAAETGRRKAMKRMAAARKKLQDLYDQLEQEAQ